MATKKKSKKSNSKPSEKKRRIPRQDALPGMGDAKIQAIETAALDYAEIRDKRQELTAEESSLKKELLTLMHKAGKTEYRRNGISVKVVIESEKVKVRVKEEGELETPEVETGVNVSGEAVGT
jgi:hypothetical protein